ncbi:AsmA family protein [Benzoatithermus flavus]|uniref:AsmA family protein n=1 Tax=Benzoatithermus flavus TaxID=3108223 RepID=A0ABU8XY45_9PROT
MRLRTILLLVLLAILAVPVIGALGLWWLDESVYRRLIAERVEQATGRKLTIDGQLHLALALRPTLAVERVTLANPPWASRPVMAELKRLELQLDALSLLSGRPEIDRIVLVRPTIHLEIGSDGSPNWWFAAKRSLPAAGSDGQPGAAGAAFPTVHELVLKDGLVTYRDGRSGTEHTIRLDRAQVLNLQPMAPIGLQLDGAVDGLPLAIKGQTGPLATFLAGERVPLDLDGRIAGVESAFDGTIAHPAEPVMNLAFRFQAADPAILAGHVPEAAVARLAPLDLEGKLAGDRRRLVLSDLSLGFAGNRLGGSGAVRLDGPRPRIEVALGAERLDLRPLLSLGHGASSGTSDGAGRAEAPLFSQEPLPIRSLRAADAEASARVGELETGGPTLQDVQIAVQLEDGRLRLDPVRLTLEGRPVTGSLAVDAHDDPVQLRLELAADRLDLGRVLERLAVTTLLEGEGDLRAELAARGASPHDLAGSLAGQVSLLMSGGGLRTAALDRLAGGAGEILATALGRQASDVTRLRCLVLAVPVADGIARPDLVLDTERTALIGKGTIDLGREQLDLILAPRAKITSVDVALPVTVQGPLVRPAFRLDEKDAARRLGDLLGGALFPPAMLDALGGLGGEGGRDCLELGAKPMRARGPAVPGLPPDALDDPEKALEAATGVLGKAGQGFVRDLLRGR